jgi:hypothetical protein
MQSLSREGDQQGAAPPSYVTRGCQTTLTSLRNDLEPKKKKIRRSKGTQTKQKVAEKGWSYHHVKFS